MSVNAIANGLPFLMGDLLDKTLDQTKALIAADAAIQIQQQAQSIALDYLGGNIDITA